MVMRRTVLPLAVAVAVATGVLLFAHAVLQSRVSAKASSAGGAQRGSTQDAPPSDFDRLVHHNAEKMIEQGRQVFRYDTFGSEAFWGDALQLHKAIAGEKNGGVGGGVSPKTALSVSACHPCT